MKTLLLVIGLLAVAAQTLFASPVIEGSYGILLSGGVPGAGTNEVQTLTIGGTPTGGTFKLSFQGHTTAAIAWSATNATLLANMNAALDALPNVGTAGIVATAGTIVAGIGTVILTFSGGFVQRRVVPLITIAENALTGTAPTLANAETTPGVDAFGLGHAKGAEAVNTATGIKYINTGTPGAPVWTVVGAQT